ncbi:hypothetical protein [Oceanirhabdus sp. W0125-5]|uniref:hypothetical protein n=1 Tax=Oceanirhabdus sp. W0125-5 TaxID=2999116 RepID=UPI0022F31A56|nr:hypothetical protein [Oceanirhabdus sp. W0125-5]WBW96437.1 hypothetical protein OW730_22495 [Oceanirhabdus sp. W0125-5]
MKIKKYTINIFIIVIYISIFVILMIAGKDIHSKIFAHWPLWINIILCSVCLILINKVINKRLEKRE